MAKSILNITEFIFYMLIAPKAAAKHYGVDITLNDYKKGSRTLYGGRSNDQLIRFLDNR